MTTTTNDSTNETKGRSFRERFEKQREKYRNKRGGLTPVRFTGSYHDLCRIINKRSYVRGILRPRGFVPTIDEHDAWYDRSFEIESLLSFDGIELNEWLCIFHEYWLTLKQLLDKNTDNETVTTSPTDEQQNSTERYETNEIGNTDSDERNEKCIREENDCESIARSTDCSKNDDNRHDSALIEACLRIFEEDECIERENEKEDVVINIVMARLDSYRRKRCIWHVA